MYSNPKSHNRNVSKTPCLAQYTVFMGGFRSSEGRLPNKPSSVRDRTLEKKEEQTQKKFKFDMAMANALSETRCRSDMSIPVTTFYGAKR